MGQLARVGVNHSMLLTLACCWLEVSWRM